MVSLSSGSKKNPGQRHMHLEQVYRTFTEHPKFENVRYAPVTPLHSAHIHTDPRFRSRGASLMTLRGGSGIRRGKGGLAWQAGLTAPSLFPLPPPPQKKASYDYEFDYLTVNFYGGTVAWKGQGAGSQLTATPPPEQLKWHPNPYCK